VPVRQAAITPTGELRIRRAMKPSTTELDRSTHCTSSTISSTGVCLATVVTRDRAALQTSSAGGAGPGPKPRATVSASRSPGGSRCISGYRGSSNWLSNE
jgi:hypothetical protein